MAVPMLMAWERLVDETIRKQALSCIERIVADCMSPQSGLPYDAVQHGKWNTRGWWYDGMYMGGHTAYLVGQALYYLVKAYGYEKHTKNIEHKN